MKELKVKVKGIQERHSLKQCSTQSVTAAMATPQPVKVERQRLAVQARRINQLSVELEAAILELKAIANDLKREQRIHQSQEPIKSMCEYSAALVPCVKYKKSGAFVLTTRQVDLFQAEREATQVAQTLRCRGKKKQTSIVVSRSKQ